MNSTHLKYTREAVNLLTMDKVLMGDEETVSEMFPSLNFKMITHFLSHFKPDE
jgi:hypothetical protein